MIEDFAEILPFIKDHFKKLKSHLEVFIELEVQLEGWMKGELLYLFDRLKFDGMITSFDREVSLGRKRIDLSIMLNDKSHYIETKHHLIGEQRGITYRPCFYFGDPTSVGLNRDVDKLLDLDQEGDKWLLLLLTKNPGLEEWNKAIELFNDKFKPRKLISYSNPEEYPWYFFLGLMKIRSSN